MPFIRGRYHINPIMGEALEAAREAEAALHEMENKTSSGGDGGENQADGFGAPHADEKADKGPVHRIEVEAAELVPHHSGRAARGYVARIHRHPIGANENTVAGARSFDSGNSSSHSAGHPSPPETHVFADHRDLVDFLHHELAKH